MSGNWITLERRLHKEALELCKQYEEQMEYNGYTKKECFDKAYEEKIKFLEKQWTRAIELEIRFDTLRQKMREEAGFEPKRKNTNPEKTPKLKYMVDITFPEETPINERLEFTKEFYTALDAPLELAIEQRGHTEETYSKGVHVHANVINKQLTLQSVKSTALPLLKKYKLKDNIIEYNVLSKDHYNNRINYIRSIKVDKPDKDGIIKSLKIPYDTRLRKELNLLNIYTQDTLHMIHTDNSRSKPNERLLKNDTPILYEWT